MTTIGFMIMIAYWPTVATKTALTHKGLEAAGPFKVLGTQTRAK